MNVLMETLLYVKNVIMELSCIIINVWNCALIDIELIELAGYA
jgi:hypothetical protein